MNRLLLPVLTVSAVAIAFAGTGLGRPASADDPPGSRYENEPWVLLSVSAEELAPPPSAIPPLRPVRFRTVAAGGIESAYDPRAGFAVRSEKRWRALWRLLTAGTDPVREPPRVDFTQEMLLVVTQGSRPAGDDHVRIAGVGDTGGSLEVHVNEYTSSRKCRGVDVDQQPYHVVRIPRSPNRAHFVRFRQPAPCPPSDR